MGRSSASVTSCLRPSAPQAETSSCRTTPPKTSRCPSLPSIKRAPKETCSCPDLSSHAPSVKTTTGGESEQGETTRGEEERTHDAIHPSAALSRSES
eukprot:6469749-Amphidinium_carterae.1